MSESGCNLGQDWSLKTGFDIVLAKYCNHEGKYWLNCLSK